MTHIRKELHALTGLRGIAALTVAIYHFMSSGAAAELGLPGLFARGYLGVDVFFVMSGFVLAYNYRSRFSEAVKRSEFLAFGFKRIARVYPAYLAFLALNALKLSFDTSGSGTIRELTFWGMTGNVLMLTAWGLPFQVLLGPSWSVSAEIACYMAFPFIVLAIGRWKAAPYGLLALTLALLLAAAASGHGYNGGLDLVPPSPFCVTRAFCGFITGILLFEIRNTGIRAGRNADLLAAGSVLALAAVFLANGSDLLAFPLFAALVFALSEDTARARMVLDNPIVRHLGIVSYSIYLVHPIVEGTVLHLARRLGPAASSPAGISLTLLAYLGVTVLVASLAYPIVEERARSWLTSLFIRSPHASAARAETPATGSTAERST